MSPKVKFEVEGWECLRCGHQWIPRIMTETEPTICPRCKSPYWNKLRQADLMNERKKIVRHGLVEGKLKEDKLKEDKLK